MILHCVRRSVPTARRGSEAALMAQVTWAGGISRKRNLFRIGRNEVRSVARRANSTYIVNLREIKGTGSFSARTLERSRHLTNRKSRASTLPRAKMVTMPSTSRINRNQASHWRRADPPCLTWSKLALWWHLLFLWVLYLWLFVLWLWRVVRSPPFLRGFWPFWWLISSLIRSIGILSRWVRHHWCLLPVQPVYEKPDDYRRKDNEEQCSYQHPEHHGEHSEAAHHRYVLLLSAGNNLQKVALDSDEGAILILVIVPFRIRKTRYLLVPLLLAMVSSYSTPITTTFDTCITVPLSLVWSL